MRSKMWITSVRISFRTVLAWVVWPLRSFYWSDQCSHSRFASQWLLDDNFIPNPLLIEYHHRQPWRRVYPHWPSRLAHLTEIQFLAPVQTPLLPLACVTTLLASFSSLFRWPNLLASPQYLSQCPLYVMRIISHYFFIILARGNNNCLLS